jgi:hypothetical protein
MGILSKEQQSNLNIVRRIRNTFAHAVKDIDFHHPLILNECKKFSLRMVSTRTGSESNEAPKEHYIGVCHTLAIDFLARSNPSDWIKE